MKFFVRYWGNISFYGILVLAVLFHLFAVNDQLFHYFVLPFVVIMVWGTLRNRKIVTEIEQHFGKVKVRYAHATPVDTMLGALLQCNQKISGVRKLQMMSHDLVQSCDYLNNSKAMALLLKNNEDIQIEMVGFADQIPATTCGDIELYRCSERHQEHKNILTMEDGRKFLWYERNHTNNGGKNVFVDGVYFISLTDEKARELEDEYETLKLA